MYYFETVEYSCQCSVTRIGEKTIRGKVALETEAKLIHTFKTLLTSAAKASLRNIWKFCQLSVNNSSAAKTPELFTQR